MYHFFLDCPAHIQSRPVSTPTRSSSSSASPQHHHNNNNTTSLYILQQHDEDEQRRKARMSRFGIEPITEETTDRPTSPTYHITFNSIPPTNDTGRMHVSSVEFFFLHVLIMFYVVWCMCMIDSCCTMLLMLMCLQPSPPLPAPPSDIPPHLFHFQISHQHVHQHRHHIHIHHHHNYMSTKKSYVVSWNWIHQVVRCVVSCVMYHMSCAVCVDVSSILQCARLAGY